ncbi:putative transmembrane protein [Sesbania bispinosa]|nr:putative transmembrane protein [Sesbania bispinosa]
MAEERVRTKKNRHLISGGGGNGVAGLVVFGGALAVAGFIAVASFATNKNKKTKAPLTKPIPQPQQLSLDNDCKSQDDHEIETTQGLRFLLPHSATPTNEEDACQGTTITRSISHTSILEEKIDPVPELNTTSEGEVLSPTCFHHQEIVLSDDSHPESAASSNNSGIEEDCLASSFDSQTIHVESQESLKSLETETHDDDDVISENGKRQEEEDSSKVSESVKEEEDNSKAILNSNVRLAEQDFKGEGGGIDIQSEEAHGAAKTDTDAGAMTVTPEATSNEKGNFFVVLNDQPSASDLVQLTTWVMPMLLLALLLLLLWSAYTS